MYNLSFFTITDRGIFAAVQLYLRLAALFWLTKVCTTLIRPDTMQKGATYLFWPLRFTGLKADEAAHIMYTALFMLPELLSSLPVFLKRGHKGLADFFAAVEKHDTEAVYAPGRLTRYYEILLVLSLPFMVGAILLGRL